MQILKRKLWRRGLGGLQGAMAGLAGRDSEAPRGAGLGFRGSLSPAEGGRQPASRACPGSAPSSSPAPLHGHRLPPAPEMPSPKRRGDVRPLLPLGVLPARIATASGPVGVEAPLARAMHHTQVPPFGAAVGGPWPRGKRVNMSRGSQDRGGGSLVHPVPFQLRIGRTSAFRPGVGTGSQPRATALQDRAGHRQHPPHDGPWAPRRGWGPS